MENKLLSYGITKFINMKNGLVLLFFVGSILYGQHTAVFIVDSVIDLTNYPSGIYLLTTEQQGTLLNTDRIIIQ